MKKTYSFLVLLLSFTYVSAQYCASTSFDPSGDYIGRVQLNTMDNSSPSVPASGYTDFTSVTPQIWMWIYLYGHNHKNMARLRF